MSGADGTVELFSVGEPSGVVNLYFLSSGGDRASADLDVPILQPRCRFGAPASDLGWTSCGGMGSGGGLLCWGVARLSLRNAGGVGFVMTLHSIPRFLGLSLHLIVKRPTGGH